MNNPGMQPRKRTMVVGGTLLFAYGVGGLLVTWPSTGLLSVIGPVIIGVLCAAAALTLIQIPRSLREIAIEQYKHLGVSDDLIENVVIRGQEWAVKIQELGIPLGSPMIKSQLDTISQLILDMIADFQYDPGDIRDSRNVLSRVIDQTPKLIENYHVIEAKKDPKWMDDAVETEYALRTMIDALTAQRVRNTDNNRLALGVDIQVTHELLRERTPVK